MIVLPVPADGGYGASQPRRRRTGWRAILPPVVWASAPPAWSAVNSAGGMLGAAMVGHLADVPPLLAGATGVLGAGAGLAAGLMTSETTRPRLAYRTAAWLTAGGWGAWALGTSPWSATSLGAWAAWAIGMGVIAPAVARYDQRASQTRPVVTVRDGAQRLRDEIAVSWEKRIKRVTDVDATISAIAVWPTGTGFSLDVNLPAGGVTWGHLASHSDGLAADAKLPNGCEVVVKPGAHRRAALVEVSVVDALKEIRYNDDMTPLTINSPFRIGTLRSSEVAEIFLRLHNLAIVGQVGSGKTNLLHVIIKQLTRCVDALIWPIDLTHSLPRPWVTPWYERRAGRPAIDWPALTESEVDKMCDDADAIIKDRKRSYRKLMAEANDDKIPISAEVPEIVIVVDEGGTLPMSARHKLINLSDTGRAVGVRVIWCGLRATDDYLPTEIKEQARNRIGMRVSEEKELAFLFGWDHARAIDPSAAPYEGCGFLFHGNEGTETLVPYKADRQDPARIDRDAVAFAPLRPSLDGPSVDVTTHYTGRWERMLPILFGDEIGEDAPMTSPSSGNDRDLPDSDISHMFTDIPGDTPAKALERLQRSMDELNRHAEGDPDVLQQFAEIVSHLDLGGADEPGQPASDGRQKLSGSAFVVNLIDQAGAEGIRTRDILATYEATGGTEIRQTVQSWLDQAVQDGVIHRVRKGLYVHRRHVDGSEDAAQ